MDISALRKKLSDVSQEHVLSFYDQLSDAQKKKLTSQLQSLDLDRIAELSETHVKHKPPIELPKDIQPAQAYPNQPGEKHHKFYDDAKRRGHELMRQGKIGAFLVAGGQGTRLGYDGPKGEYPITPVKNKPLFQVFAEQ